MATKFKNAKSAIVGSRKMSRADATIVSNVLRRIQNKGLALTAKTLLNESRNKGSPTHRFFEWDDSVAGEQHRLSQAASLIREVRVEIQASPDDKVRRVHAFVSVVQNGSRSYEDTAHVFSKKELRNQVLAEALQMLEAYRQKYADLTELAEIFEAFDRVKRKRKAA